MSLQIELRLLETQRKNILKVLRDRILLSLESTACGCGAQSLAAGADLTALWVRTAVGGGFPTELLGQGRWLFA